MLEPDKSAGMEAELVAHSASIPAIAAVAELPPPYTAEWRRCPSCDRWGGVRVWQAEPGAVQVADASVRGPCQSGPWHGSLRGVRNACGRWVIWAAVPEAQSAAGLRHQQAGI